MFLPVAINTSCTHTHRLSCTQKVLTHTSHTHTHTTHGNTARSHAATLLHDLSGINFSIFFFHCFNRSTLTPGRLTTKLLDSAISSCLDPADPRCAAIRCLAPRHTLHPTAHRHTQHAHLMGGAIPTERLASLRDTHRDISQTVVGSQQLCQKLTSLFKQSLTGATVALTLISTHDLV